MNHPAETQNQARRDHPGVQRGGLPVFAAGALAAGPGGFEGTQLGRTTGKEGRKEGRSY